MPKTIKTTLEKTPTKTVGNVFVLTFPSVGSPFNSVLIMCFYVTGTKLTSKARALLDFSPP